LLRDGCLITAAIGARKPTTAARHNDAFVNRDHSMSSVCHDRPTPHELLDLMSQSGCVTAQIKT